MAQQPNGPDDRTIYNEDPWSHIPDDTTAREWFEHPPDGPGIYTAWTIADRYRNVYQKSLISGSALNAARTIVYGTAQVTGQLIGYVQVPGASTGQYYLAYALCQGPVDSATVYSDGVLLTSGYNSVGYQRKTLHLGANDVASQPVDTEMSLITGWTENHGGLCYVVIRSGTYTGVQPSSLPTITATVTRGNIADLAGGADVRSDNPVNALYDWWTSEAAMRRDPAEIHTASWEAVRDWCDDLLALHGGGSDYRVSFNLAMSGDTIGGNLEQFFRAVHSPGAVFVDSQWILWNFRTLATNTLTVTAEDFAKAPDWGVVPLSQLPTHVSADYIVPADDYGAASIEVSIAYDLEAEDEQVARYTLPWCTDSVIAERWARHRLNIDRNENIRGTLLMRSVGVDVLPGDRINVTDRTGVAKNFRVLAMKYREDGVAELELQLYLAGTQVNVIGTAKGEHTLPQRAPSKTSVQTSTELAHYIGEVGDWKLDRLDGDPSNLTTWTEVTPADTEITWVPLTGIEGYTALRYTGAGTEDRIYAEFTIPESSGYVVVSAQFYLETGFDTTLKLEYEVDSVVVSTIFDDSMAQLVPDMWHRVFAVVPVISGTTHRINVLVTGAAGVVPARIRRIVVIGQDQWLHANLGAYERWTWTAGSDPSQRVHLSQLIDTVNDQWLDIGSVPVNTGEISLGYSPMSIRNIPMDLPSYTYRLTDIAVPGGSSLRDFSSVQSIEVEPTSTHEATVLLSTGYNDNDILRADGNGHVEWIPRIAVPIEATTTYVASVDDEQIWADATAGDFTVQLPAGALLGKIYNVTKVDATGNIVTVTAAGGGTIASSILGAASSAEIGVQYDSLTIRKRTATEWIII